MDLETLREVGLIAPRDQNAGFYDRFRDRVMFPIRDVRGQTVGFGGRILPTSPYASRAPKYYNSSETPLFNKSELLFGLDQARSAGATEGYLAVVEGYTDVMMAHQVGVPHVVATMGTALNARHVRQLRRYVPRVVLVFDADAGGMTGIDRALEIFVAEDVDLQVATLPEGLDPCDLIVAQGAEPFRRVLASAVDALDFKLNLLLAGEAGSGLEGTRRTIDAVLALLALTPAMTGNAGRVKRELMVTRIAHRLGLRQETVWARLGELRSERRTAEPARDAAPAGPIAGPAPSEERELLEVLLADPGLVPVAILQVTPDQLTHPGLRRLLEGLYALHRDGEPPDLDGLRVRIDSPSLAAKALDLQMVGRTNPDRRGWLQRIVEVFRRKKDEVERKKLKSELQSASDHAAALDMLRRLQGGGSAELN
jgi:DNA primase